MFWAILPWWMFSLMLTLRQREGFRVIDNRPESLIYVQGGDVQALFNFLLNCRSCVASSGPQAGVPPTIISPSPFTGASIHSDKVRLKFSIWPHQLDCLFINFRVKNGRKLVVKKKTPIWKEGYFDEWISWLSHHNFILICLHKWMNDVSLKRCWKQKWKQWEW